MNPPPLCCLIYRNQQYRTQIQASNYVIITYLKYNYNFVELTNTHVFKVIKKGLRKPLGNPFL